MKKKDICGTDYKDYNRTDTEKSCVLKNHPKKTNKYKPKNVKESGKRWESHYLENAIKEYSSYIKVKLTKKNYKDKIKQLVNKEFKLKRRGYYFSIGFIDQACNLCKKCIRPIYCNNALARPNWNNFPILQKKYNLKKREGIILIAPEKSNNVVRKIPIKKLDFFDRLEKRYTVELYCIESKEIEIGWKEVAQCIYGCRNFSKFSRRYCCPPFSLTPDETKKIQKKFKYVVIINKRIKVPLINISWLGFNPIRDINQKLWSNYNFRETNRIGNIIEKIMQKRYDVYAFGATCNQCLICGFPYRCKKPDVMRFVPEGCGIDVYSLAKKLRIPIEIPPHNKVNFVEFIFFNK